MAEGVFGWDVCPRGEEGRKGRDDVLVVWFGLVWLGWDDGGALGS